MSFAGAEHMARLLHTVPGSVSALELLFDTERRVKLVIDRDLLKEEMISGHPGFSTSTLRLSREDLLRYVETTGHTLELVELPAEPDGQ